MWDYPECFMLFKVKVVWVWFFLLLKSFMTLCWTMIDAFQLESIVFLLWSDFPLLTLFVLYIFSKLCKVVWYLDVSAPFSYESNENMTITCSTKVCSFGKQVVEKVETEHARLENGRYVYRIHRSAMCEYMINFIHKLKHLPEKYMMNSVLENFTILQVGLYFHFS